MIRIQLHYVVSCSQDSFILMVHGPNSVVLTSTIPLGKGDYSSINLVQPLAPLSACSSPILLTTLVLSGYYIEYPSTMTLLPQDIVIIGKDNLISSADWYFLQSGNRIYFYPTYTKAGSYLIDIYIFNTHFNTEEIVTMIVASPLETPQYNIWGNGVIGGMAGETLSFYVTKYDAYGNALYVIVLVKLMIYRSFTSLSVYLVMETQLISTQQVVLSSNMIRVTYQITELPGKMEQSSLVLTMSDSTIKIPIVLPLSEINIYAGNVAWENSEVSICSSIEAGKMVTLSFIPRDSSNNQISPEFINLYLDLEGTS